MKRLIVQLFIAFPVWLMLGSMTFAMCIWFAPPSRQFEPATNMKVLASRDGNSLTMTVQPQFTGDATDFALVMPFPSEPTVSEAPKNIFRQLENLTNPEIEFDDIIALSSAEGIDQSSTRAAVEVIEERDVGDFSTVTLKADSEEALIEWLTDQGYEIPDGKKATIASYVNQGGYFVALKVNMSKAEVDLRGVLTGELDPISFTFESAATMLPLRLMAGEKSLFTLTIYTLAEELTYIPGAEIQFSKKVTSTHIKDYSSLEEYDAWQKWLVRNVIQFDPSEVEQDLVLQTTVDTLVVVPGEQAVIFNPEQLEAGTGVVISEEGKTIYTEETKEPDTSIDEGSNPLTGATVVILAISNVVLLGILVRKHSPEFGIKKK